MSRPFRDLPIRRKLALGITASSVIPLFIAALLALGYGYVTERAKAARDLRAMAETLAVGARVQLEFQDPKRATETLTTFTSRPAIMAAALFTANGQRFAAYVRPGLQGFTFPAQLQPGHRFLAGGLEYVHPIGAGDEFVGHLFLQSDLQLLNAQLVRYGLILAGVMACLLAVTWWVSRRFEEAISHPIVALAQAAHSVQTHRDYSVRATKEGEDEIGQLTDAFNQMLAGIQEASQALRNVNESLQTESQHRAQVEEALRQLNETLEQRVAERTAAAEAASRTKSEFLANMSHELRTPLNSVIGFSNILFKNKPGNLRPDDLALLERILANGKHLLGLINEILDLTKIEARKVDLDLAPVHMDQLITEVLATQDAQVRDRPIKLSAELPPNVAPIRTDAGRLRQVLINLVGNALKFTERGSITLRLAVHPVTHRPLRVDVVDTGIGIPKDRQAAVFEAFQQADSGTARKYGGTGLGLTISRALCGLLQCRLELQSEPGQGATFTIHFEQPEETGAKPRKHLSSDTTFLPRLQRSQPEPARRIASDRLVLVIDDEADARDLMSRMLEDLGCKVVTADTGNRALAEARRRKPDLILLDLMMPNVDGWQVLQSLKADAELTHIPVVITSVVAHENQRNIIGAVELLQKPIAREDLQRVIGTQLRMKVLVVEDNRSDQRIFANGLATEGVEYRVAGTGREALLAVEQFAPDVVLLDLLLPGMGGMEFLQHLRSDPRHERLPVFIVTAKELSPAELEMLQQQSRFILRKSGDLASDFKRFLDSPAFQGVINPRQPTA